MRASMFVVGVAFSSFFGSMAGPATEAAAQETKAQAVNAGNG